MDDRTPQNRTPQNGTSQNAAARTPSTGWEKLLAAIVSGSDADHEVESAPPAGSDDADWSIQGCQPEIELVSADLEAPVAKGIRYPSWRANQIQPGLFMGGTHDDATVADPMALRGLGMRTEFDAVVTLYAWAQPVDWEVEELRYGFGDGALHGSDLDRVLRAARWAHERWQAGDRVLIRCQAGLNRSGLVTALVLMLEGWSPADAIVAIRAARSPHVLFNRHFVRWLLNDAEEALGVS